jgi:four helix bundle protein
MSDEKYNWDLGGFAEGGEVDGVSEPDSPYKAQNFKDFRVWQEGMELVRLVYKATATFPREELYGLTSQLKRASVSVPSNIAEGWGRNRKGYLSLGMSYSRGSIHEVESQLLNAIDLGFMTEEDARPIMQLIMKCSSGLFKFMTTIDGRRS